MPTGDGPSLGAALSSLIGNYTRSGGTRSSYSAVSWHAQLVQLTSTERGRAALGNQVDVTRRTFLGWLSEDVTPRRENREKIAAAYDFMRGGFPQALKEGPIRISGDVTTGPDTRTRGDGRHAPLLVDGSSGDWSRIEELWNSGDLDPDLLEEYFVEDVVYQDDALGDGSGGWDFTGGAYTVSA